MEFAQIWYNYQKIRITNFMQYNFIPQNIPFLEFFYTFLRSLMTSYFSFKAYITFPMTTLIDIETHQKLTQENTTH